MSGTASPAAQRTRQIIIDAAIAVWSTDNAASLGAIAERARVGRTTLHRHFPGRDALIGAVDAEARRRFEAAVGRSRPDQGTGLEALGRMIGEILGLGDLLGLVFADNALVDPDSWGPGDGRDDPVIRGQSDGSISPDLPASWIQIQIWTTLFGAHLLLQSGEATVHEATDLAVRTLTRGIRG